jgi:hypothetical protein
MAGRKGKEFERETAALAGKYGKRVPLSGAIGTTWGSQLAGDAIWKFPWLSKSINLESKHGYGGKKKEQKSMTIYREWFTKHINQARALGFYPAWAMKFKFTMEDGLSKFVLIPFPVVREIMNEIENLWLEKEELLREQEKRIKGKSS